MWQNFFFQKWTSKKNFDLHVSCRPNRVTANQHKSGPIKQILIFLEAIIHRCSQKACNFIKKRLQHRFFPLKFAEFLRTPFLQNICGGYFCFLWFSHTHTHTHTHTNIHASDSVHFSTPGDLRAYRFTKRHSIVDLFVKFLKFYGISFLQKTAGRLLPISSNISNISLALYAINQLSHSWLAVWDLHKDRRVTRNYAPVKRSHREKYLFFSPGNSKRFHFKREIVPIDDHNQGIFFSRLGHFFPEFEKRQERPPSPSPTLYLRAWKTEAVVQSCSVKKVFLEILLRPATLSKKRLWHRCFPVNFAKFLRTPFFTEHLRWLLLEELFASKSQCLSRKYLK